MIKLHYKIIYKTYDCTNIKLSNYSKLFFIKEKKKKKFIIKKSSFKYNKSQEQYALFSNNLTCKYIVKNIICPKLFEILFVKSFKESNYLIVKLNKKEFYYF